ncbi:MAG: histidine phosphatase family protein [Candidatus Krumholzibacteriota bacterium]|nr:histidine phosphatase family protein [Candidatus Krumholzibacteriota bacterium]
MKIETDGESMLIYLIRHGRTDWNEERRIMGVNPVPLNDRGREMVEKLASFLGAEKIGTIYSGTLKRTMETAKILAGAWSAEILEEPRLNESPYEKWAGKRYSELEEDPDFILYSTQPTSSSFSENEGMIDIQKRSVAAIERILSEKRGERAALVSHSDVIKPAIANYLGMKIDSIHALAIANASISLLDMSDHRSPKMRYINLMPWKWKKERFWP